MRMEVVVKLVVDVVILDPSSSFLLLLRAWVLVLGSGYVPAQGDTNERLPGVKLINDPFICS